MSTLAQCWFIQLGTVYLIHRIEPARRRGVEKAGSANVFVGGGATPSLVLQVIQLPLNPAQGKLASKNKGRKDRIFRYALPKPIQFQAPSVPILAAQPDFIRSTGYSDPIVKSLSGTVEEIIMSVLQRTIRMFVLAAMAVAGQVGMSQEGYHPFSEPMSFDPDWQFFAPVQLQDLQDLTARQRANNGFYIAYDRMQIGLNRSTTEAASNKIDFTWGNRFDFGWMNSKESGWMFSTVNVGGPNVYNQYEQNRLNQFIQTAVDPTLRPEFQNDDGIRRMFIIQDSVNVGSFSTFEANKVWRMEPYRYGGILEPMVGVRYAFFGDGAANDTYTSGALLNTATPPAVIANFEDILRDRVDTDNHMVLGQVGFRYTKFMNRWTLSNDFKFFGGHVYQSQTTSRVTTQTVYPNPIAIGATSLTENDRNSALVAPPFYSGRKGEKSTIGFDLRVEGSYKATKYLDVRGGFAMMYFARGIWRGSTLTEQGNQFANNQNLIMPAFTFGIALNR